MIFPWGSKAWCAIANENISGKTRAPRCSKGMRSDHNARLPPAIEGDADINKACRSLKGCGRNLDVQSITFLRCPGMEALYSGDEIMNASLDISRLRNCSAPGGIIFFNSISWLYEGQSNSFISAKSTMPPCFSMMRTARRASRVFSESILNEAEKMRKRIVLWSGSFEMLSAFAIDSV